MRNLRAILLAVLLLGPARSPAAPTAPKAPASKSPTLTLELVGFRSDAGRARVALYRSADGYPTKPEKAWRLAAAPVAKGAARVVFAEIPAGTYAVSVYHDENNNGKLDANWLGIPKEGTGASNDAKGRMGPPRFEAARFQLDPPGRTLTIHLRYL
jgi:uncharacterized protein (DUF2141 family)